MPRASATCEECGKVIARKADLKRHMKVHSANKEKFMFSCPWPGCDHKTLQRSNMNTHINTHSGRRPCKCPIKGCRFRSTDPASLSRHRRDMHGYKPRGRSTNEPADASHGDRSVEPYETPLPEPPQKLALTHPLVSSEDYRMKRGSKNGSSSFNSQEDLQALDLPRLPVPAWIDSTSAAVYDRSLPSFSLFRNTLDLTLFPSENDVTVGSSSTSQLRGDPLLSEYAINSVKDAYYEGSAAVSFDTFAPLTNASLPSSFSSYDDSLPTLPPPPATIDNTFLPPANGYDDSFSGLLSSTAGKLGSGSLSGWNYTLDSAGYGYTGDATNSASFDAQRFDSPTWSNGNLVQATTYAIDHSLWPIIR